MQVIETKRLILRTWEDNDADVLVKINQDPKVIEFLRGTMTLVEVRNFVHANNHCFEKEKQCFFAATLKETKELIGFIGLSSLTFEAHFSPCVEIGWRLSSVHWGKGYATEGAKAVLQYGFNQQGLNEIISFTVPTNLRSIRVMEKIGMQRDMKGDFLHPKLPADHKLSQHILYRKQCEK